jgi:hypothetical protein
LELPLEAKNKKQLIFGDKYGDLFSEETTAGKLILPLRLFENIEQQRTKRKAASDAWSKHASFYILFATKLIAVSRGIPIDLAQLDKLKDLYEEARNIADKARERATKGDPAYEDVLFFKSGKAKSLMEAAVPVKPPGKKRKPRSKR